ncbi:MAG TPA: geranylgeranylglyceryl/heptaprenylglyceryl phosphate synthase [Bacteroidales bacterium]|nr:geranylgeranylglyceryl/heptaprenylglyceryl phosphate synthase [Bacteroidales bacterium]HRZ49819.1 geranylgeranylglyceryl/heptaprenylglyceryl phosphate synthase [Bacteroidales bacterium]
MAYSMGDIYQKMTSSGRRQFAVLADPDKLTNSQAETLAERCNTAEVDYIFTGGSLVMQYRMEEMVSVIRRHTRIPVVLFPGNVLQVTDQANAILFLSLISGRNPEMLIGRHVEAAPILNKSGLEVIPTGYMLVESGALTTALYMSGTIPVPRSKPDVAACTALAGQMLGLQAIYLDAGSGALQPVPPAMIAAVKAQVHIPVIVGGGIRTTDDCLNACKAGADIVVVGNAIESRPDLIAEFSRIVHTSPLL